MNILRQHKQLLTFFLTSVILFGSGGCYARFRMQSSRLVKNKDIKELNYVLITNGTPVSVVYVLRSPEFDENGINTAYEKVSESLTTEILTINTNKERAAHKNFILIYLKSDIPENNRIEYSDIKKMEVFERNNGTLLLTTLISAGLAGIIGTVIAGLIVLN